MIDDWMPTLKTNLAAISGIEQVHKYDEIPGTLSAIPAIIIMPQSGSQVVSAAGVNTALHSVHAALYVSSQVLPEAYGTAIPFIEQVLIKVAGDLTLGGNVDYCKPVDPPEPWYEGPGALGFIYANKPYIGILFKLLVKENLTLTVA